MRTQTLVLRGLRFYWRSHASVFAGVVLATAVLTGALIMGDSVDHSLRGIALARLGEVHYALHTPNRFVRAGLAEELGAQLPVGVAPMLGLRSMAFRRDPASGKQVRANQVEVLGVGPDFWAVAGHGGVDMGAGEVALNQKLAKALGVAAGDDVSLRIMKAGLMAFDAPLAAQGGARSARSMVTVKAVLPDTGLGRFSLSSDQVAPYNAFVPLDWLQEQAELPGWVNTVVVGGVTEAAVDAALAQAWRPEHVGLRFREEPGSAIQLESERVFLDAAVAEAALEIDGAQGTLAYLVNGIAHGDASTPYSFAVAGDAPVGMTDSEAVINAWTAEQLGAGKGDSITVSYLEVSAANEYVERQREFVVREVRSMEAMGPARGLVPDFPGLSDVERCQDWNIGMPMDEDALADDANEAYWEAYRQTPKLLVTLNAGQAMWANRFGAYTGVCFPGGLGRIEALRAAFKERMAPERVGLRFAPVRAEALRAVDQAMDFGGLFVGMSFFLIVAALVLTAMLFVFGVQQRARELGTLLVLGFRPGQVRRMVLAEAGVVALLGALTGALAGSFYARLLIAALTRFWGGALAQTHIAYHASSQTLFVGALAGLFCACSAVAAASWRQSGKAPVLLMAAGLAQGAAPFRARRTAAVLTLLLSVGGLLAGAAGAAYTLHVRPANIAMPFFGVGALLLLSGLGLWNSVLLFQAARPASGRLTLARLAIAQAARRPARSTAVAGLLACGVFLVLAVASMREDLDSHAGERWSGTGGFALFAQTTLPLADGQLGLSGRVFPLRVRDGDDASCLNLNHSQAPPLFGADAQGLAELGAFDRSRGRDSVWALLDMELPGGEIPALVGDADTAMWGLQAQANPETGAVMVYRDERDVEVPIKLVGTLPMRLSVFQGALLVSEAQFTRLYPSESGYRSFLIEAGGGEAETIAAQLGEEYERYGMDAVPAVERLREFYVVETTYLAMFLVLGGLGVTLGAVGMGIVTLRNLLERRGEIAMFGVLGFDEAAVLRLLLVEHALLFAAGIGIGLLSALVSTAPSLFITGTHASLGLQAGVLALVVMAGALSIGLALYAGRPADRLGALRAE